MPLLFIGDKPQGRIMFWISSTESLSISVGLLALAKRSGVIWFTRSSVHWALRRTAIKSV